MLQTRRDGMPLWAKRERLYRLRNLAEVGAKEFPNSPTTRSLQEYCIRGLMNTSGFRVRLDSVRIGRVRYSSIEAYWRFLDDLNS